MQTNYSLINHNTLKTSFPVIAHNHYIRNVVVLFIPPSVCVSIRTGMIDAAKKSTELTGKAAALIPYGYYNNTALVVYRQPQTALVLYRKPQTALIKYYPNPCTTQKHVFSKTQHVPNIQKNNTDDNISTVTPNNMIVNIDFNIEIIANLFSLSTNIPIHERNQLWHSYINFLEESQENSPVKNILRQWSFLEHLRNNYITSTHDELNNQVPLQDMSYSNITQITCILSICNQNSTLFPNDVPNISAEDAIQLKQLINNYGGKKKFNQSLLKVTQGETFMMSKSFLTDNYDSVKILWNILREMNFPHDLKTLLLKNDIKKIADGHLIKTKYTQQELEERTLKQRTEIIEGMFHSITKNHIDNTLIHNWYSYMANRCITLPFNENEIAIYTGLKQYYEQNVSVIIEENMKNMRDRLISLRENTSFDRYKFNDINEKCYFEQDYDTRVAKLSEITAILQSKNITKSDIIFLSVISEVAELDPDKKPKLTPLGHRMLEKRPDFMEKIMEHKLYIQDLITMSKEQKIIICRFPDNNDAAIAMPEHSHKAFLMKTTSGNSVVPMIFTSRKTGEPCELSPYQETSHLERQRKKKQMVDLLPHAVICGDDIVHVDLLATAFFYGNNISSELVLDKFIPFLKNKQQEGCDHILIRKPFLLTYDIVKELTLQFYDDLLLNTMEKSHSLKSRLSCSEKKRKFFLEEILSQKEDENSALNQQKMEQYFTQEIKDLRESLKIYENKEKEITVVLKKRDMDKRNEEHARKVEEEKKNKPKSKLDEYRARKKEKNQQAT